MKGLVQVYPLSHLAWLAGIAGTSIALASLLRRGLLGQQYVRAVLVCGLVCAQAYRFRGGMDFPHHLPLQICNLTSWVAVIACLGLYPAAVEFTYFAGLAGAGVTLLTPVAPDRLFFVQHGVLIVAASALVFGRIAPLREGAFWRAYGYSVLYLAFVGVFDWATGANYAYLRKKPHEATLMNVFGQWPYYILIMMAVGLLIYWLLWLPVRPGRRKREPIPAAEHLKASA
jgi:hypothetical integral membrane protein (TIGR02206 family)